MEAAESNNVEQLDPAYVGSAASAPLAGATRRLLLQQQAEQKALENAAAMTQRAEQMFLFLPDGLHSSGMLPVRVKASSNLQQKVSLQPAGPDGRSAGACAGRARGSTPRGGAAGRTASHEGFGWRLL